MERLTERFRNGQAVVKGCGTNCKYDYKYCESYLRDCPTIAEIYEKIAAYEDAGLTPEQIKEIDKLYAEKCKEVSVLKKERWVPTWERFPENGKYVLVSFENFSLLNIARYEEDENGGAFYPGDDEKSYSQYDLFVNAWMPLPEPYREEEDE